ncbi:hypothetical protein FKM82_025911 [Ascaphus truei]
MMSTWSLLQKRIFSPREERLLEATLAWKVGRKRKSCILCIIASVSRPLQLSLVRLKKTDRGEQQGERWPLQKLRVVDGRDALHEVPDFDLHFEKVYKWTAASYIQKCSFMACLWKVNQRYLSGSIKFLNILPYLKGRSKVA